MDVVLSITLDDCLFDLDPDNIDVDDSNVAVILNGISKKINAYILTAGADDQDSEISSKEALYNICKNGKANLLTEYMERILSDIDEILEACRNSR